MAPKVGDRAIQIARRSVRRRSFRFEPIEIKVLELCAAAKTGDLLFSECFHYIGA
jgi:hypothetical protein